jgi:hypothetical protein
MTDSIKYGVSDQEKIDEVLQDLLADPFNMTIVIEKLEEDKEWTQCFWEVLSNPDCKMSTYEFGDYTYNLARKYLKSLATDLALDDRFDRDVVSIQHICCTNTTNIY